LLESGHPARRKAFGMAIQSERFDADELCNFAILGLKTSAAPLIPPPGRPF